MAKKAKVNLMVRHVLLFHPAFVNERIDRFGIIGEIQYIYSSQLNWEHLEKTKMFFGVLRS